MSKAKPNKLHLATKGNAQSGTALLQREGDKQSNSYILEEQSPITPRQTPRSFLYLDLHFIRTWLQLNKIIERISLFQNPSTSKSTTDRLCLLSFAFFSTLRIFCSLYSFDTKIGVYFSSKQLIYGEKIQKFFIRNKTEAMENAQKMKGENTKIKIFSNESKYIAHWKKVEFVSN